MPGSATNSADLDWLERDRHVIKGLDHLGVQVVSVSLYALLLPGITNVTERARYYSFYPWVLHRYAQRNDRKRGRIDWLTWFRRLDFAFCMASVAHEIEFADFDARATAVVGADTARRLLKNARERLVVNVRAPAELDQSGRIPKKDAYFQNSEGGLGQYYKGSLRDLGLVRTDSEYDYPDCQLTNHAGLPVAKTLEENAAFEDLLEVVESGKARFTDLASLGKRVGPAAIRRGSREESLLRALIVATDDDLCRGQDRGSRLERRSLVRLMLAYARDSEFVEGAFDYEFRWACAAEALPSGRAWKIPRNLRSVASCWGAYQRNDLLNHCLECLFWLVLRRIDEKPFTIDEVAKYVVDLACERIPAADGHPSLPAVEGTVSSWLASCGLPGGGHGDDRWDDASTWRWSENLDQALDAGKDDGVAAWALRLLGRLASDRGTFERHPFEHIPQAIEMASAHEISLHSWLERLRVSGSQPVSAFIRELVHEWVVFRHLRVATRKLATQGVSTFKLRPERGSLVPAAQDIPDPTYTSPRLRQGHRILVDLHLLEADKNGSRITAEGLKLLDQLA